MIDHGPWKIVKSEVKYSNGWINIIEDTVIQPDGKQGIYGHLKKAHGVMILPIDTEGNVYLVDEFKYPMGKVLLEVPAGAINPGEDTLVAAKRELKEEVGIEADEWTYLGYEEPLTPYVQALCHMYIARGLHFGETKHDGTESMVTRKMPFAEAVEKVMDGTILHAQCALHILKAKLYLESEAAKA